MGARDTSNNRAVLDALKGLQDKIRVLEVLMLPGASSKIPPRYGSGSISVDIFVLTAVNSIMVDIPLLPLSVAPLHRMLQRGISGTAVSADVT